MLKYRYVVPLLIGLVVLFELSTSSEWQVAVQDAALRTARPILIPLVNLLASPSFVYGAATAIFLAGVIACLIYWFSVVRPEARRLRLIRLGISALPMPTGANPSRVDAMRELGNLMRREKLLLSAWATFQSYSARTGRLPEQPFSHFAGTDPDANSFERRSFMNGLPGYFTSVGLILTFLGLVIALYFAAKGFQSGNMQEARGAILQLLNASAFKFITSVAALGAALLISVVFNFGLSILHGENDKTILLLEAYISEWRDFEGEGASRDPLGEVAGKLDVLIDAMSELNGQIARLSQQLVHAGKMETGA